MGSLRMFVVLLALASAGTTLSAQTLPAGPLRAFDGQLTVGAEVVAGFGDTDDIAYFNYTDYEHNALRLFRLTLSGVWRPARRLALVGEVRSEDLERARPYAAYVRIRPWPDRAFDVQIGRIPPAFGAFGRMAYNTDNALIGYPLAYQYLTSLRPNAIPAVPEDLIRMRGRGWLSTFPVGDTTPAAGVPLVSAFRWDTGLQARWMEGPVEVVGAVTAGTLSDPRVSDSNDGRQISARVALRPIPGLILGTSGAHGAWAAENVIQLVPAANDSTQTAWGADAEYSRDHWIVRSELVWSRWRVPFAVSNPSGTNLDALGVWAEGRYRFTPRIFAAARVDRLGFSTIRPAADVQPITWDGGVNRVEVVAGYYLQRNLTARLSVQRNHRDAGRIRKRTYFAGQLSYWF
jgi:hypothetical protein